jgi:HEPN domain-containing protein
VNETQANLGEEIRGSLQEAERLSKLAAEKLNESPPEADRIAQQALGKAIEALRMKFGKVTEYERLDEVLKKAGVMGERAHQVPRWV